MTISHYDTTRLPTYDTSRPPSGIPFKQLRAVVHAAEDGRCEACGRPSGRAATCLARRTGHRDYAPDDLHLLCVDCKARQPDQLRTRRLLVAPDVARALAADGQDLHAVVVQFGRDLRRYGVVLTAKPQGRRYWLPGIGAFLVSLETPGVARVTAALRLYPAPRTLRRKAQAQTRGLPRPDRGARKPIG